MAKGLSKKQKKWIIGLTVLTAVVALSIWGYTYFQSIQNPYTPTASATGWTINYSNSTGDVLDDDEVLGYLYSYDASDVDNFDDEDWNALGYSDLTLEEEVSHAEVITPDAETYYWLLVNGTGYNSQWVYLSAFAFGDVDFVMLPTPSHAYITGMSTKGGVSLNQTNDNNWRVYVQCVDADYEISDDMGYRTTIDYSDVSAMEDASDSQTYIVIEFDTNSTSMALSDIEISGLQPTVRIAGDKVQFCFTEDITGLFYKDFVFSSNLGSTFEIEGVALKTGLLASLSSVDTFV